MTDVLIESDVLSTKIAEFGRVALAIKEERDKLLNEKEVTLSVLDRVISHIKVWENIFDELKALRKVLS